MTEWNDEKELDYMIGQYAKMESRVCCTRQQMNRLIMQVKRKGDVDKEWLLKRLNNVKYWLDNDAK